LLLGDAEGFTIELLGGLAPTLPQHRALELGEDAHHLEHRLAGRGAGVEALLVQVQIDALGMQLGEEPDQLLQRPAEAIDRPCSHLVELAPGDAAAETVISPPLSARVSFRS
jgi:hypothetical protein